MPTEINYFLIDSASDSTSTWIAIVSVLVSLCALIIAAAQTFVTRNHNKISVKPHLAVNTSQENGRCSATLKNTGFGPAKLISATLYLDDTPLTGGGTELIESAFRSIANCTLTHTEFFYPPYVLPTNESLKIFEVEFNEDQIDDFRNHIITRLRLDISYSCFYGDIQYYSSAQ